MKKIRTNRIMLKIGAMLVSAGIMFSSFLWIAPLKVSAAEPQVYAGGGEEDTEVSYYPKYEAPEYVLGKLFMGTDGLTAPVETVYGDGKYYAPTSYVYFGTAYDSQTDTYIPLVHRVLDPDNDNAGNGGAMFLLSEFATNYQTKYSLNSEANNDILTIDNIYSCGLIAHSYTIQSYAGGSYRNAYSDVFPNIPKPLDYIRQISKYDVHADMLGLFKISVEHGSYRWDVNDYNDEVSLTFGVDAEKALYLNNATFFPLSAKELNDYVATVSGAPGLAVKYLNSDEYASYWLRTGIENATVGVDDQQLIGQIDTTENGNLVGAVNTNGLVTAIDSDVKLGVRYGFNLETSDIVFTLTIDENTHRLAFIEPLYKDTTTPFGAQVTDVKGDVVTVKYWNAIRDAAGVSYSNVTDNNYLSVMIKDKDNGAVKHYGSVSLIYDKQGCNPSSISSDADTASFRLPKEYEDGDEIYVFWERKDEYSPESMSHVSNMVKLECIHVPETEASCAKRAKCAKCGESYGGLAPNDHANVNKYEFYFDVYENKHWNVCPDCFERVNVEECQNVVSCASPCICGNVGTGNDVHDFDERGICKYNSSHFELPQIVISDTYLFSGKVNIENEGQLISLANLQNSGYFVENGISCYLSVYILADLDFKGIGGYTPIGTDEYPFCGAVYGKKYTVKNIEYYSDHNGVGLFGTARVLSVKDLMIDGCVFEGSDNAGILLGKFNGEDRGVYTADFNSIDVTNSVANATNDNGKEGILIADPVGGANINDVYTHNVKNGNVDDLRFSSDDSLLSVQKSVYLSSDNDTEFARTAEQYASGQVAHEFNMRQFLGDSENEGDPTPSHNEEKPRVGKVSYCDGTVAYYTNERLSVHLPMDRTIHRPTEFYEFVWNGSFAEAKVYCDACEQTVQMQADVKEDLSYVPVRGDYTASITVGGVQYTETITIIGRHIEDQIGMTYIEKDYDGFEVHPEDMMNNHRLNDGSVIPAYKEYEVYFVDPATGKKLSEIYTDTQSGLWVEKERALSVSKVGTYDLLVVGKKDYAGQEYTYKSALVIKHVEVTVTPEDVYKYYDGNAEFAPEYTVDVEGYDEMFELVYSDADSAEEGEYTLSVEIRHADRSSVGNVSFKLSRDNVRGYIYPRLKSEIVNKSYPTEFTYGDDIEEPKAEHFMFTEGASLRFEWFEAEIDRYTFDHGNDQLEEIVEIISMNRIYEKPCDAGDYVLRVIASHTHNTIEGYIDIPILINPRELSIELQVPEGVVVEKPDGEEYTKYYLDMGVELIPAIVGFVNGDTAESVGARVEVDHKDMHFSYRNLPDTYNVNVFPYQPNMENYYVFYRMRIENSNYTFTDDGIVMVYVAVKAPTTPTPIVIGSEYVEDGENKEFGVVFGWNPQPVSDTDSATYEVTLKLGDEVISRNSYSYNDFDERVGPFMMSRIRAAGEYTAEIVSRCGEEEFTETLSFTVAVDWYDESLDAVTEMGEYEITVTDSNTNEPRKIDIAVKREIVMNLKEFDYFISEGKVEFDKKNIVMEAGKVVLLTHELVDATISVNTQRGYAVISSITVIETASGRDVSHLYKGYSDYNNHTDGGYGVAHIFDAECDTSCNVPWCEYTRSAAHSGGAATCTSLAVCEKCHAEYGTVNINRHTSDSTHIIPNAEDEMTHLIVHSCCGVAKEIKGHVVGTAATCTERAVCGECGWKYGELDPTNHSSEESEYKASADDTQKHVKTRACCGEITSEDHSGGEATCTALAKCQFCLAEYGELDSQNHGDNVNYTANENNGNHDAHCSACDAKWSEEHTGGVATCIELAVCVSCKSGYGELDADNHTSEEYKYVVREENRSMHDVLHSCCGAYITKDYHSGGIATCNSAALCEFCGGEYGNKNPEVHGSEGYKYTQSPDDKNSHVKYHECCGLLIGVEPHTVAKEATCEHANVCECGIEYGEKLEHVYDNACDSECNVCEKQTRSHVFHVDANGDKLCDNCSATVEHATATEGSALAPKLSDVAISGICTAGAVGVAAGGFSVVWFAIKKKTWEELLKLFIK